MIHIKKPRDYFWIIISFIIGNIFVILILYLSSLFKIISISFGSKDSYTKINTEVNTISNHIDQIIKPIDKCDIYVDISGAVMKPNVYCLKQGSIINDAIKIAGGYSKNYAKDYVKRNINLSVKVDNHMKIYIPYEKEQICSIIDFRYSLNDVLGSSQNILDKCISINSASLEQLMTISGIGESTAKKIIDGRPYKRIDDLLNVSGIGNSTFEKMKAKICI